MNIGTCERAGNPEDDAGPPEGHRQPEQALFDERTPIYRQIADQVREDILTGVLTPDEQVMSTNQYAAFHRINPATVAKAFQRLVDEGLLYKKRGIGMFVTAEAPVRLRAERRAGFAERVLAPAITEADRLGIGRDELVDAIRSWPSPPGAVPAPATGTGTVPADGTGPGAGTGTVPADRSDTGATQP